MATSFTHEVGFRGLVSLDSVTLLATGGNVSVSQDPIFSSGVWGAGWYNAAEQVAYALNVLRIEGDVSYELTAGAVFNKIRAFAFTDRCKADGKSIKIFPNGEKGYNGKGWCSSCGFDCSVDSIVTGSFNFMGYYDTSTATSFTTGNIAGDGRDGSGISPSPASLFPFWKSKVTYGALGDVNTINWSGNYSSSIEFLTLCNGKTNAPKAPDYLVPGPMTADGSFTVFGIDGTIDPASFHDVSSVVIAMNPGTGVGGSLTFADVLRNNGSVGIQTGGSYLSTDISFTAIGDGSSPPMSL